MFLYTFIHTYLKKIETLFLLLSNIQSKSVCITKELISNSNSNSNSMMSETATAMKECPVCYDEIASTNNCITSCGHSFCLSCMLKCIQTNNSCPCCRTSLIEKKNIIEYDSDDDSDDSDDGDDDYSDMSDSDNYDSDSDMSDGYRDWLHGRREEQRIRRQQRVFNDETVIIIDVDGTISDIITPDADDEISIWEDIETDDDENYDDDDDENFVDAVDDIDDNVYVDAVDAVDVDVDVDDGYGYFGSKSASSDFSPHPQWECVRNCEQQVVDIDVNWLMTMMC